MTLVQVQEEKRRLEEKIRSEISKFEETFGVSVSDVRISYTHFCGQTRTHVVDVKLVVEV